MVLIRETKKPTRNVLQLGGSKGIHALFQGYPKIFFIVNNKDRSIPIPDKVYRVKLSIAFGHWRFPVSPANIIIMKPGFLCCSIHALQIKYTIMSNQSLESFLMMTCQPIN